MRDNFKSLQLSKPTVEMNDNPDAGSQKLEVGSFTTLFLISRSEFLTSHHATRSAAEIWDALVLIALIRNRKFDEQEARTKRHFFGCRFCISRPINAATNAFRVWEFRRVVFIFTRLSNPNRRFHLFSFRESVFSGIFSGTGIVWKGVSLCALLRLPVRGSVHGC